MSAKVDTSKFKAGLRKADAQTRARVLKRMNQFTEIVAGVAAERAPVGGEPYSPRDPAPGTLQSSATVTPATIEADGNIKANIGFNTEYAAVQHERLDFRHKEPGQAKYLESAMRDNQAKLAPFVGKGLI